MKTMLHHFEDGCRVIQADATKLPLADHSVDLTIGSPPYPEKGERYGDGSKRWPSRAWVPWMVAVTREALRVSRGPVCWIVNGAVRHSRYLPAVERLITALDDAGIHLERPLICHKNAPPNRRDWFGNDWEYVVVAKHPGPVPHFDWHSIGTPPRYTSGGKFRQRSSNGERRMGGDYPENAVTRPRDVLRATVGGGHLGSRLAHENEAPFPERLVEPLILALCPPDGTVLDPFCGSGTTLAVALRHGRHAIGVDVRSSQVELTKKRLRVVSRSTS